MRIACIKNSRTWLLASVFTVLGLIAQVCEGAPACRCNVAAGAISLAFPALNPSLPTDFTNVATIPDPAFTFTCVGPPAACGAGVLYSLSVTGLSDAGSTHRLRHASQPGEFIPYTISINSAPPPPSARGAPVTVTVSGSVFYSDYQNSYFGTYSDILTITITP